MIYCPDCGGKTVAPRMYTVTKHRVCLVCSAKIERTPANECECGNPKERRARACQRCTEIDFQRTHGQTRRRVLSVLMFQDWCPAEELWSAIDCDERERMSMYKMLTTMTREGLIERRGNAPKCEYRLVQRKRRAA